jgi:hypothetical protein
MNPEAQAKLDEILANDPSSVTEEDLAFLNARRSYLTKEQCETFGIKAEKAKKSEDVE